MEGLMKSMLDKLPPWAYQVFAVVMAAGMIFYFVKTLYINKKLSDMIADVMRRDDRMQDIQLRMDELRSAQMMDEHTAQQTLSALRDVKPFMDALNDIRAIADPYSVLTEASFLLQRMLDILAVDMKLKAGGASSLRHLAAHGSDADAALRLGGLPEALCRGAPAPYRSLGSRKIVPEAGDRADRGCDEG
ncbi:hypothetical protein J27TS7_37390 [Paenibacillus dendritiformis]|uniref:hypothetical protein n=1 Tax=Paenibacillus dendritiformis TaxID=130049 RepID=UPI001AFF979C|nr:hypothetical protein [Paenibacillus dendritiformis]GIO74225.1 hypothetical protein J27TS7_37390 [Paenibacillus dendritiformis]